MNVYRVDLTCEEALSLAWDFAHSGQCIQAEKCFQIAMDLDETTKAQVEFADFLADFVSVPRAIQQLEIALRSVSLKNDLYVKVRICNRLAERCRQINQLALAQRYQQTAIAVDLATSKTLEDSLLPETLLGQARNFLLSNEASAAMALLTSLTQCETEIASQARLSLAEAYLQANDYFAARFVVQEVITQLQKEQDSLQLLLAFELQSKVLLQLNEPRNALEATMSAIEISLRSPRCAQAFSRLQIQRRKILLEMSVACQTPQWN